MPFEIPFDEIMEERTPFPGNICKNCGGRVVKIVSSIYQGRCYYYSPACERCGRRYPYAKNVPTAGEKEFAETLQQRFTI